MTWIKAYAQWVVECKVTSKNFGIPEQISNCTSVVVDLQHVGGHSHWTKQFLYRRVNPGQQWTQTNTSMSGWSMPMLKALVHTITWIWPTLPVRKGSLYWHALSMVAASLMPTLLNSYCQWCYKVHIHDHFWIVKRGRFCVAKLLCLSTVALVFSSCRCLYDLYVAAAYLEAWLVWLKNWCWVCWH